MQPTSHAFKDNARARARPTRSCSRRSAIVRTRLSSTSARRPSPRLPEFEALRDAATAIKDHTLAHLDLYLEAFEQQVHEQPAARCIGRATPRRRARSSSTSAATAGARTVTKGKSMIAEEIGAQRSPRGADGIEPVETDLGEYIIQLRGETPSHIIAPAIHLTKEQVEADFRRVAHASAAGAASSPSRPAARRGAPRPAPALPRRRCRHHRRQFPDRRDRHVGHRHQRGQRRPDADPAQGAHRARHHREGRADAGGRA